MGIIKTAMLSGAAMYGAKQIARTVETRGHNNNQAPPPRSLSADPEYQEYLEWKRGQQQSSAYRNQQQLPQDTSGSGSGYNQPRAPPLLLPNDQTQPWFNPSSPPVYDQRAPSVYYYEPTPQRRGFVESEDGSYDDNHGQQGDRGRMQQFDALVNQGMNMLQSQSQGGKKGKNGGLISAVLRK